MKETKKAAAPAQKSATVTETTPKKVRVRKTTINAGEAVLRTMEFMQLSMLNARIQDPHTPLPAAAGFDMRTSPIVEKGVIDSQWQRAVAKLIERKSLIVDQTGKRVYFNDGNINRLQAAYAQRCTSAQELSGRLGGTAVNDTIVFTLEQAQALGTNA